MPIVGSTLPFKTSLYDKDPNDGGVPVNALDVTLVVTKPDGTEVIATVTNPPAVQGKYVSDFGLANIPGRYVGVWTFNFAGGFVSTYTQVFDVQPADPGMLISLNDAKQHLRIPEAMTANDDAIMRFIDAATEVVEFYVGPCIPRTVVEYVQPTRIFALKTTPVLSITSIVPYRHAGSTFTGNDVIVDEDGVVQITTPGRYFGFGYYEVTYVAGRRMIPSHISQAVKIILGHMWETQRGASGLPYQNQQVQAPAPGQGYTLPYRALELLKPSDLGPSVG